MTGFASTLAKSPEKGPDKSGESARSAGSAGSALAVELRSVNGRFLDLVFKLPEELRGLEPGFRELLTGAFRRGKIEMRVATQREADTAWPEPSTEQLNRLARTEATVRGWLPEARPLSVNEIMNWCRSSATPERLDDTALEAARRCIEALREARAREGAKLVEMLTDRSARLRELAAQAEPLIPAVVQRQQERFLERWNEALTSAGAGGSITADAQRDRALNEAAAFAIRIDVAEELTRLRAHLDEIERLLKAGGELGKRLDFLIQELHREANTLGSKSAALELTGISVEMKVLIEQMREQVQNIE
jgi:uncharacterized protein (TIGR00255 family)